MGSRAAALRLAELARVCRTQGAQPTPAALAPFAKVFESLGQPASSSFQLRASVLPAQDEYYDQEPSSGFQTRVDDFGAVSQISENELEYQPNLYRNIDGHRNEDGRYAAFTNEISSFIPKERQYTDAVRTFAYGTDASFYRLNPKMVVKVSNEQEIVRILPIARRLQVPVTFRAAGTSLSGQAVTDSVLLKLSHNGRNFRNYQVHGDGSMITVEPGLIGGEINKILERHFKKGGHQIQYKIGPDPSSIDSAMVGGMVSNNSSGMCCGVSQNTYHTLKDMRVVFADGTVLDTADPSSRQSFMQTHKPLVEGVIGLAQAVQADKELSALIRRKFSIKCTTGYSLNALVDFPVTDPIEIIKRLMIGSEGTFGFVSRATYHTVPEWPHKASTFVMFPHMKQACEAARILRDDTAVDAVEVFDRASIKEIEVNERMQELVPDIRGSDKLAAGLLIECRGQSAEALQARINEVNQAMVRGGLQFGATAENPQELSQYPFRHEKADYSVYWDVRKGLIPIVGGARESGTSMLIEDVACPVEKLGDMTLDLIDMFERYGYKDASCFGHALEGNLHLVFSQGFRNAEEVKRFSDLIDELCFIVATKHSGSLKGEHGTGRNMAPFVEMEWGRKAYGLMWDLKELFDPDYVLNPGVILNQDPDLHVKNLKTSHEASPLVNHCIECGFCESACPSKDVTLTPRQRITSLREIHRLREIQDKSPAQLARLQEFEKSYDYMGNATCAADGMCQTKCPVAINTGSLIKSLRADELSKATKTTRFAQGLADNFGMINATVPTFLNIVDFAHKLVGPKPLEYISRTANKVSGRFVPTWNPYMPQGASRVNMKPEEPDQTQWNRPRQVVYAPACVTRMMGPSASDDQRESVHEKLLSLFKKANYQVIYPENLGSQCCGMMFGSRGLTGPAAAKGSEFEAALLKASDGGRIPIVMDTSPCLSTMKSALENPALKFSLYEPVEFIKGFLMDKLEWNKVRDNVAIHVPCSSKKMGIEQAFEEIASKCSHEVTHSGIPCCGAAGDRGMRYPELVGGSLQHLNLPEGCTDGYSTSRTCEMTLSNAAKLNFRGLVYLVDEATSAKQANKAQASA
ncbi:hypothetical protein WJX74_009043 [Apatococcus lobatus]|uniref:D-lactate dehydrogenase (cytochrome) n=1 Tax=Apatococcus lobatus TaxID=904363 RepID=A0AAW1SCI3_9CHLO